MIERKTKNDSRDLEPLVKIMTLPTVENSNPNIHNDPVIKGDMFITAFAFLPMFKWHPSFNKINPKFLMNFISLS